MSKSSTNTLKCDERTRSGPNIFIKALANRIGDREWPNGKVVGCHWVGSSGRENASFSLHSFDKGMQLNAALMSRVIAYLCLAAFAIAASTSPMFEQYFLVLVLTRR